MEHIKVTDVIKRVAPVTDDMITLCRLIDSSATMPAIAPIRAIAEQKPTRKYLWKKGDWTHFSEATFVCLDPPDTCREFQRRDKPQQVPTCAQENAAQLVKNGNTPISFWKLNTCLEQESETSKEKEEGKWLHSLLCLDAYERKDDLGNDFGVVGKGEVQPCVVTAGSDPEVSNAIVGKPMGEPNKSEEEQNSEMPEVFYEVFVLDKFWCMGNLCRNQYSCA